ncbi:MAG: hypothetical protein HY034_07610 [Nitrospirae bacterium]|nr:hypothetical protein [Nitrospirota bacterium]
MGGFFVKIRGGRSSIICGQCHSRPLGVTNNEQPINKDYKMMLPGR